MSSWLSCKAMKGMLPDELAVLVSTAEGKTLSFFVSAGQVTLETGSADELDGDEVSARIRVEVLEKDDSFGLIALPGEPLEGPRVARVSSAQLTAMA